jgi:DNA repair photolyase
MLKPYLGEFLISPIPLELSLNYCSHKCAYCFANLNKPDRKADLTQITNLIVDCENRETTEAKLLAARYPVLISNKVDGFAHSNYKETIKILELLQAKGVPVAFQTKGGKGIDDALKLIGPSAWYISMGFNDDEKRKKIEPGAPCMEDRYKLAELLISKGHYVSVGINPIIPEWLPDYKYLVDRCMSIGVKSFWLSTLHLNNNQTRKMSQREKDNLTPEVISKAYKHTTDTVWHRHWLAACDYIRSVKGSVYYGGYPTSSTYWDAYTALYPKLFPTLQGFINKLSAAGATRATFKDFLDYNIPMLPKIKVSGRDYLGAFDPEMNAAYDLSKCDTYARVLAMFWDEEDFYKCPARNFAFDYIDVDEDNILRDERDMPIFSFNPKYVYT